MSTEGGVEVRGLAHALRTINSMGERAKDIRPTKDRVRSIYLESNRRHLSSPGWAPLSDETIERKQRQGLDSQPERATGALYRSLTEQRAKGQRTNVSRSRLRFGSRLFYAPWQQGTKSQPTRDQISLTTSERERMARILSRYVSRDE
jgi:hypothetical protein